METGLASPLAVTSKGTAVVLTGSDLIKQLLFTALRDCSSGNPFQQLGVSDENIFSISDAQSIAKLRLAVQRVFARFEVQSLARLVPGDTGLVFSKSAEGAVDVQVKYVDLETDKPETVNASYSSAGGWR
jgi:hypothetical protein